jgi:hypothetical protein
MTSVSMLPSSSSRACRPTRSARDRSAGLRLARRRWRARHRSAAVRQAAPGARRPGEDDLAAARRVAGPGEGDNLADDKQDSFIEEIGLDQAGALGIAGSNPPATVIAQIRMNALMVRTSVHDNASALGQRTYAAQLGGKDANKDAIPEQQRQALFDDASMWAKAMQQAPNHFLVPVTDIAALKNQQTKVGSTWEELPAKTGEPRTYKVTVAGEESKVRRVGRRGIMHACSRQPGRVHPPQVVHGEDVRSA